MKKIKLITEKWQKFLSSGEKLILEEAPKQAAPAAKPIWVQLTPSMGMDAPRDLSLGVKEQFPKPHVKGADGKMVPQDGVYSFYRRSLPNGNQYRVVWSPADSQEKMIVATSKRVYPSGDSSNLNVKKMIECLGKLIVNQVEGLQSADGGNIGRPSQDILGCQELGQVTSNTSRAPAGKTIRKQTRESKQLKKKVLTEKKAEKKPKKLYCGASPEGGWPWAKPGASYKRLTPKPKSDLGKLQKKYGFVLYLRLDVKENWPGLSAALKSKKAQNIHFKFYLPWHAKGKENATYVHGDQIPVGTSDTKALGFISRSVKQLVKLCAEPRGPRMTSDAAAPWRKAREQESAPSFEGYNHYDTVPHGFDPAFWLKNDSRRTWGRSSGRIYFYKSMLDDQLRAYFDAGSPIKDLKTKKSVPIVAWSKPVELKSGSPDHIKKRIKVLGPGLAQQAQEKAYEKFHAIQRSNQAHREAGGRTFTIPLNPAAAAKAAAKKPAAEDPIWEVSTSRHNADVNAYRCSYTGVTEKFGYTASILIYANKESKIMTDGRMFVKLRPVKGKEKLFQQFLGGKLPARIKVSGHESLSVSFEELAFPDSLESDWDLTGKPQFFGRNFPGPSLSLQLPLSPTIEGGIKGKLPNKDYANILQELSRDDFRLGLEEFFDSDAVRGLLKLPAAQEEEGQEEEGQEEEGQEEETPRAKPEKRIQVRQNTNNTATISRGRKRSTVRTNASGYSRYFSAVQKKLLKEELKGLSMKGLQALVWVASKALGIDPDLGDFGELDIDGDGAKDGLDGRYGEKTYLAIKRLQKKFFETPGTLTGDLEGRDSHDGLVGLGTLAEIAKKLKLPGEGEKVAEWFVARATKYAPENKENVKRAFDALKDEIPDNLFHGLPDELMSTVTRAIDTVEKGDGNVSPRRAVRVNVSRLKKQEPQAAAAGVNYQDAIIPEGSKTVPLQFYNPYGPKMSAIYSAWPRKGYRELELTVRVKKVKEGQVNKEALKPSIDVPLIAHDSNPRIIGSGPTLGKSWDKIWTLIDPNHASRNIPKPPVITNNAGQKITQDPHLFNHFEEILLTGQVSGIFLLLKEGKSRTDIKDFKYTISGPFLIPRDGVITDAKFILKYEKNQ